MKRQKGFTLIELLLVLIIIVAIAMMVLPRLTGRADQVRNQVARVDIRTNIATALKLYEMDNGTFPTTEQGLEALLAEPDTVPLPANWNGPYMESEPVDPWDQPYQYIFPGDHKDYDLFSFGKDGTEDDNDITNWS